eukprot:NODE_706_length_4978_cov_0.203730.p4 type:complete len:105 gc:universal NODE_706_length_4978_cov_0.203730:2178-1864(-)
MYDLFFGLRFSTFLSGLLRTCNRFHDLCSILHLCVFLDSCVFLCIFFRWLFTRRFISYNLLCFCRANDCKCFRDTFQRFHIYHNINNFAILYNNMTASSSCTFA